ncbi:MAG: VWA domain-containing protein [Acidobacteria bacterium]|nr:VWA domain-containing protein [Acidobacteriota bacterium]
MTRSHAFEPNEHGCGFESRRLLVLCLLMAGLVSGASSAQPQPPPQPPPAQPPPQQAPPAQPPTNPDQSTNPQQPTFRAGISFVRVDVIVTDRDGKQVSDLTQADFDVTEDGKPQTIETFKMVQLGGELKPGAEPPRPIRNSFDEESEAARDDVRIFAIFLDDYHVRLGSSMSVRDPLINFVTTQLGSADLVGLMYPLTPLVDVRMTRDRDSVGRALKTFEGRKYDYRPRNEFEDRYALYPASTVEQIRNQVSLSALKALVMHLGGLREGRKAVILVSEGYTSLLPPQLRDPIASMPGFGNPNRGNPMAGQGSGLEDRAQFTANLDLQMELREVYDAANRTNTTIYALDPRGLAASEFDISQNVGLQQDQQALNTSLDSLRTIADQTDGRAIVNRNDLTGGLRQVIRDSSAYYLIGYNSTQAPSDGKFHKIDVRLKAQNRRGLQVRARKGYWALTAEETARATAPRKPGPPAAVERALSSITETRRRFIQSWLGTSKGEDGKTRVTFVWEPTPAVPGQRRDEPARVAIIAAGAEGRAYFRGKVPDVDVVAGGSADGGSLGAAHNAASPAGVAGTRQPNHVTFDAQPGRMELRLQIEGKGGVLDSDVLEVVVPDFSGPETHLSTPRVMRARNAVEFRALSTSADPAPTAGREFRRTDRLLIRLAAYGPGTTVPPVTAKLLNRGGQSMSDLPVTAHSGSSSTHQIDLPLASLPAGEFIIEIKAKSDAGEAAELVPIRISG